MPGKVSFFTWMLDIYGNGLIDELRKIERAREGKIQMTDSWVYQLNCLETNIDAIGLDDIVAKLPENID
ncbi:MAG: hypothetical protein ACI9DK_002380 [Vicingaceae bacterium]